MWSNFVIFAAILFGVGVFCSSFDDEYDQIEIGEKCKVERTQQNGIYKLPGDCPSIKRDTDRIFFPSEYGYDNGQYLVCCPNEDPPVTPPAVQPIETKINTDSKRISAKKCIEYHDALLQLPWRKITQDQSDPGCPISIDFHIVDGNSTIGKEFPHMALIGFPGANGNISWQCGGSLISDEYVLTAGHCLSNRRESPKYVLLGDVDYASEDDDAKPTLVYVGEVIKHPNYSTRYKYDDIGLIRLAEPVELNEYVRPICLPESSSIPSNPVATGWGRNDTNGVVSSSLQKVELNMYTHQECNDIYAPMNIHSINKGIINATQFCANDRDGSGDTCQGDSGGPLQLQHDKHSCMYTIVGITSFGIFCGTAIPAIYTRVSSYLDWIESVVWPNATQTTKL